MDSPGSCISSSSIDTNNKRKRSDSIPTRRTKAPRNGDVKVEGQTPTTIPKGPYDDLGFDPFAPHPGMTKEERKLARMIRNRNAAQASRDRKKEHVTELELRVQELEAQLAMATQFGMGGGGSSVCTPSEHGCPTTDFLPASLPIIQGPSEARSERSPSPAPSNASTISPTQAASLSQARIAALEEENGSLRDRLEAEARRSGELKGRLAGVEQRFENLEKLLGGLVSIASNSAGSNQANLAPPPDVDWASVLAPTPTIGSFPANVLSALVAPTCATPTTASSASSTVTTASPSIPAVPSITMTNPEDPSLNSVTNQSNSNRLVAADASFDFDSFDPSSSFGSSSFDGISADGLEGFSEHSFDLAALGLLGGGESVGQGSPDPAGDLFEAFERSVGEGQGKEGLWEIQLGGREEGEVMVLDEGLQALLA